MASDEQLEALIEKATAIPPQVLGYFEWFSGTIRVNLTREQFLDANRDLKYRLEDALNHEMVHVLQVCQTGYLHNFLASTSKLLFACFPREFEPGTFVDLLRNPPSVSDAFVMW